jgi:hypothetical protein
VTAPNGHTELIPFKRPDAPETLPLAPATWTGGAMTGWREAQEETRRMVRSFEPITPAAIPGATAQRPGGPSPQLATAVANLWELVKGAGLLGLLVLAGVMLWLVARGVLWVA